MKDEKHILIATDGSAGSRVAIEEGLELAESLLAGVTFVSVRPAPSPVSATRTTSGRSPRSSAGPERHSRARWPASRNTGLFATS